MQLRQMLVEEEGQNLIEYAVVTALIALGAFAVLNQLGLNIANAFYNVLLKGVSVFFQVS